MSLQRLGLKILKTFVAFLVVTTAAFDTHADDARVHRLGEAPETRVYFDHYRLHEAITEDGVRLPFIELLNTDGSVVKSSKPAIYLQHGYTQSLNTYFEIADSLRKQGHRVFVGNFRGHGQGTLQAVGVDGADPATDSRLVFERLATDDVPALLTALSRITNGKIVWVGHSMGGMMMHLALGGLKRSGQSYEVSSKRAEWVASRVAHFVALGSPVSFERSGFVESLFMKLVSHANINADRSQSDLSKSWLGRLVQGGVRDTLHFGAQFGSPLEGLINLRNISRAEYDVQSEYMGSRVPKMFAKSVMFNLRPHGYASLDGKIDYARISMGVSGDDERVRPLVPTLIVSADKDMLAPLKDQNQMVKNRGLKQKVLKDTGHLDMVMGEAASLITSETALSTNSHSKQLGRVVRGCRSVFVR